MFFLFGCARKKETSLEVQQWLERTFPGQFKIVKTEYTMNQWISSDKSRFTISLESEKDPDIQFLLVWNRGLPDGGLTRADVEAPYETARSQVERARNLYDLLRQNKLERVSVGVHGQKLSIMVFTEPSPDFRLQTFAAVQAGLENWNPAAETEIRLFFMEENAWGEQFREIIPAKWLRALEQNLWQQDNCIQYLDIYWSDKLRTSDWLAQLRVNHRSLRTTPYRLEAFRQAQNWAKQHLAQSFHLDAESLVGEEPDAQDHMAIKYSFPYFSNENDGDEPAGYISVVYQTEQKTCKQFKLEKEF